MTDPFEALRLPETPVDPDPGFAADLRARLVRATLTWEDPVTTPATPEPPAAPVVPVVPVAAVAAASAITPYIMVVDARRALDWYAAVFGGHVRGEPYVMPDGAIGHAELGVGDGVLMLADADAAGDNPLAAPAAGAAHSHTVHVQVPDVDAAYARALGAGAAGEREPADYPYGRGAVLVCPFGHRWMLMTPSPHSSRARPGDVGYLTKAVRDVEAAKAFYGAVLGWEFTPGQAPGGWQVRGRDIGLWGGGGEPRVDLCFRVGDLDAAVAAVRAHGGAAGEVDRKPYGSMVECADPDGVAFQLWQP